MPASEPVNTTISDLCNEALKECGYLGIGQTALAEDLTGAFTRLQWLLQQWERKRWLVYHLVDLKRIATGQLSYTVGPGGQFDTGSGSVRPARLESVFVRQIQPGGPNQVDFTLDILQSREDYNKIALKSLASFPSAAFLDSDWPLGNLFIWPLPSSIYEIHISIMAQLEPGALTLGTVFALPYEYYAAMLYNLAMRLRPRYRIATFPGDPLAGLVKDSLNVLRGANLQIARLSTPYELLNGRHYNIFGDRFY